MLNALLKVAWLVNGLSCDLNPSDVAPVTMLLPIKFHCPPDLELVIGETWGERGTQAELMDIALEHLPEGPMMLYHVVLQSSNIKIITDLFEK